MRFGVQWAAPQPGEELTELAREMEDLGYWSIGFPDHFSRTAGRGLVEPCIAMSHVAAVTQRLRVGQLVCNNDLRHPAVFAWQMAHLDLLSGGRVEAGIGAGWNAPEYEALGIPFDRPGVRIARLAEAVQVMRAFWESPTIDFTGEHYEVRDLAGEPKPVQDPLPLLIGGNGTKTLTLAGTYAQIAGMVFPTGTPDEDILDRVTVARGAAAQAGRDPAELVLQVVISWGGGPAGSLWELPDDPSAAVEELHRRAEMGFTYFSINSGDRESIRRFGRQIVSKMPG